MAATHRHICFKVGRFSLRRRLHQNFFSFCNTKAEAEEMGKKEKERKDKWKLKRQDINDEMKEHP